MQFFNGHYASNKMNLSTGCDLKINIDTTGSLCVSM